MSNNKKESKNLSASRIKTLQSCSWLYWCKYILKMPDKKNDGSSRGTICHLIFEVLGNKRHKKHFDKIMKTQDVFSVESIKRLIIKHAKILEVDDFENISLIKQMIFNGLSYDFFGKKLGTPTQSFSEREFAIEFDDDNYYFKIRGFIDKLFLYNKKKYAVIRDFKTSKSVFLPTEIEDNMQDLMYSFAVTQMFPEYQNTQSEFLFLKFDLDDQKTNEYVQSELFNGDKLVANFQKSHVESGVVRMQPITQGELEGFKHELTEIQKLIDNFSEKDAVKNFAVKKGFPKDGTFSGKLMCGFASKKGELKKDGSPKWHCAMKFDFNYFHIKNADGDVINSVFEEEFNESLVPEGGTYEMKHYAGCPAHCS